MQLLFFMGCGSNYLEVSNGCKKGMAASIVELMVYLEIRCESSYEVSQLKIVIKWGRQKRLKTRNAADRNMSQLLISKQLDKKS